MRRAAALALRWRLENRGGALGCIGSLSNAVAVPVAPVAGRARPFGGDAASGPSAPTPRYPRRPSAPGADPYAWIRTADPRGELGRYLAQESRMYRAAGLASGGAPAARRAIERAEAAWPASPSSSSSSSSSLDNGAGRAEPSGPYEYWQQGPDGSGGGGWALMRRRRRSQGEGAAPSADTTATTTTTTAAAAAAEAVLSSADVRADAALAARRLFKGRRWLPAARAAANELFGPGHDQVPPDVRLSRDHALVAYLLPYAPSASGDAAAAAGRAPPPEGSALLVVRAAAASPGPLPPLAMVRAVTGAEFSPWFDRGDPCVYYVEPDVKTGRPACVRRRSVLVGGGGGGGGGGGACEDESAILFNEPDPRFFVALTRTKDWRALAVNSHSKVSSEVRLLMRGQRRGQSEGGRPSPAALAATAPTASPPPPSLMLVAPRRPGVEYFVEHWRGRALVLTNAPELFLSGEGKAAGGPAAAAAPAAAPPICSSSPCSAGGRDYALLAAPVVAVDDYDGAAASAPPWRLGPFVELAPEPRGRCSVAASAAAAAARDASGGGDDDNDDDQRQEEIAATADMDVFDAGVVLQQRDAAGRPALSVVVVAVAAAAAEEEGGGKKETAAAAPPVLLRTVGLPRWALELEPAANQDPSSPVFRFDLSSPCRPPLPYEMDLATAVVRPRPAVISSPPPPPPSPSFAATARPTRRQTRAPASPPPFPPDLVYRRVVVPCLPVDGPDEGVPLTLLQRRPRRGSEPPAPAPVALLESYGAYGRPLEAGWRADRAAAALDRGWIVALAHARGGGELGRRWHRAGRASRKGRSARDVLACARWLAREGLARPAGGIALCGASAGAVAAAGALLLEPALFGAAVLEVPFVDALAEMEGAAAGTAPVVAAAAALDLLAQHELDEWGDDDDDGDDGDDDDDDDRKGEDEDEDERVGRATTTTLRALERGACPYQALLRMARRAREGGGPAPALPPLLLTAAADDARVRLQGVVRFAALYRDVSAAGARAGAGGGRPSAAPPPLVLLRVAAGGGHFGGGTAASDAGEVAEHHEFVRRAMQGGRGVV